MSRKPKRGRALWCSAFPDQAKRLRPEAHSKAGGVRVRSQTEQIRMSVYKAIKKLYLARHLGCECCLVISPQFAPNPADQIHHVFGRKGWLLIDIRKWKSLCRWCHDWIHKNPDEARKLKLLAPKGRWNTI